MVDRVTAREEPSSLPLAVGNRSARVLIVCGVIMVGAFGLLAWHSHRALNAWSCLLLLAVAWGALARAWRAAAPLSAARILPVLWVVAAALRLTAFVGAPILEDDWFRYLWDGRQLATTGNPYRTPPMAHFADESVPEEFQTVLNNINHPDVPTIYGPVCQYLFALSYGLAPAKLWPLKLGLIAADLLALWLLLKLTTPRHALLFAWCPLLVQESSFTAHPEILGVLGIVAALWARQAGRPFLLALFCAAAVAARIHAGLLVPFLLWPWRGRPVAAFIAALALLYLPFWMQGSAADLAGLKTFLDEWEFNSSIFALVKAGAGWQAAKLICGGAFLLSLAALLTHFARQQRSWTRGEWPERFAIHAQLVLGVFFLLSAVVNPWYLLWLAPWVAIRPTAPGIVALMVVSLSYLHGGAIHAPELAPYEHPKWLRPLEYGLILAAAVYAGNKLLLSAKHKTH
jgi:hypothetical protein